MHVARLTGSSQSNKRKKKHLSLKVLFSVNLFNATQTMDEHEKNLIDNRLGHRPDDRLRAVSGVGHDHAY